MTFWESWKNSRNVLPFDIRIDDAALKRLDRMLSPIPGAMPKVMSRALNRTAEQVRTVVTRTIRDQTRLKLKDVRKHVKIRKATYSRWHATVKSRIRGIYAYSQGARQTPKGVTFKTVWGHVLERHAFIAVMPRGGHIGVFKRYPEATFSRGISRTGKGRRKGRLPIYEVMAMSGTEMYDLAKDAYEAAEKESAAKLAKNINYQVELILKRRAAG